MYVRTYNAEPLKNSRKLVVHVYRRVQSSTFYVHIYRKGINPTFCDSSIHTHLLERKKEPQYHVRRMG